MAARSTVLRTIPTAKGRRKHQFACVILPVRLPESAIDSDGKTFTNARLHPRSKENPVPANPGELYRRRRACSGTSTIPSSPRKVRPRSFSKSTEAAIPARDWAYPGWSIEFLGVDKHEDPGFARAGESEAALAGGIMHSRVRPWGGRTVLATAGSCVLIADGSGIHPEVTLPRSKMRIHGASISSSWLVAADATGK